MLSCKENISLKEQLEFENMNLNHDFQALFIFKYFVSFSFLFFFIQYYTECMNIFRKTNPRNNLRVRLHFADDIKSISDNKTFSHGTHKRGNFREILKFYSISLLTYILL